MSQVPGTLSTTKGEVGSRAAQRAGWGLAMAVGLASVVCLSYLSRDTWFRSDVWDFLLRREAGSVESWLRPHAGHLQWPHVGLHRLLYGTVGLDFWPWYHLPHIVGYAVLSLYMWRVFLRRGADRSVAFVAYLVLLFLGVSAFLSSYSIGFMFLLPTLVITAGRLDADGEPSQRERWVVFGAALLMVTTSTTGVAALAACLVVLAWGGRWRRWWWCLVPAVLLYGAWYWVYGSGQPGGDIHWHYLPQVPAVSLRLLGLTLQSTTGLGGSSLAWGVVGGLAVVGGVGWLARQRRLRIWDLILLGTLAGYMLMVGLLRGPGMAGDSVRVRYGLVAALLMTLWVVPHLRFGRRWPPALRVVCLVAIGCWLLAANVWLRVDWADRIEAETLQTRERIEAVAAVVRAGEPAIESLRLKQDMDIALTGVLRVADIRQLLASGWQPRPGRDDLVEETRGAVRMHSARRLAGEADPAPLVLPGADERGCVVVAAGEAVTAEVVVRGWLRVIPSRTDESSLVSLTWRDGFGQFTLDLVGDRRHRVQLASPVGQTGLTVENSGSERVRVCAVGRPPTQQL